METNLNNLINEAKKITLTESEKALIKARVATHIQTAPIPSFFVSQKWYDSKAIHNFFSSAHLYIVPVALLVLVIIGGGTSEMAQRALPGDPLYPIKINFNEKLESFMAISPEEKAMVSVNQATRRLAEVEIMEVKGSLAPQEVQIAKDSFVEKVNTLNKNLQKIEKKGETQLSEEIEKNFSEKVNAHYEALINLSGISSNTAPFVEIIKSRKEKMDEERKKRQEKNLERLKEKYKGFLIKPTASTTATTTLNISSTTPKTSD